jgi:hypothetical protein
MGSLSQPERIQVHNRGIGNGISRQGGVRFVLINEQKELDLKAMATLRR